MLSVQVNQFTYAYMVYWWCPAENFILLHFSSFLFLLKWDFNVGLISTNFLLRKNLPSETEHDLN